METKSVPASGRTNEDFVTSAFCHHTRAVEGRNSQSARHNFAIEKHFQTGIVRLVYYNNVCLDLHARGEAGGRNAIDFVKRERARRAFNMAMGMGAGGGGRTGVPRDRGAIASFGADL